MTFTLTTEQQRALAEGLPSEPVRVLDPTGHQTYVLVRDEVYQRFSALLSGDEFTAPEAYAHMQEIAEKGGWLDPEMDAYDALDPRKP